MYTYISYMYTNACRYMLIFVRYIYIYIHVYVHWLYQQRHGTTSLSLQRYTIQWRRYMALVWRYKT